MDAETIIGRIMERHGAQCGVEEFHSFLNVTFHEFESACYDEAHADMWESLPAQFDLLLEDCLGQCPEVPERMGVLDIGCGTGLATACLLRTAIGRRIASVDLLDTSPKMLARASHRATTWPVRATCHQGLLDSLPSGSRFELIVACSVLHHVPDLRQFLQAVRRRAGAGRHLRSSTGSE